MLKASSRKRTDCSDGRDVQQELVYLSCRYLVMIVVRRSVKGNFQMFVCGPKNREAGFFLACKFLNTAILSGPPVSCSALSCSDATTPLPEDRLPLHLLAYL